MNLRTERDQGADADGDSKFGENLFWAWDTSNNGARPPSEVVGSWMSEASKFDYNNPDSADPNGA